MTNLIKKLKYTKANIEELKNEFRNRGDQDADDFIESRAEPILLVPEASDEERTKNRNINWKFHDTCFHCGRGAKGAVMFHMVNGGGFMASKKDSLLFSLFGLGDMYLYCIGSTCAKKFTKEVLKPRGLDPKDYFWGEAYVADYEDDPDYLHIGDTAGYEGDYE
tara:strand:+ start:164 stop:655 length:492 start_codon:yes stop_codon:yes gene_type:complete